MAEYCVVQLSVQLSSTINSGLLSVQNWHTCYNGASAGSTLQVTGGNDTAGSIVLSSCSEASAGGT